MENGLSNTNIPKEVITLTQELGIGHSEAVWDCHGTWVMYHKICERLAAHKKIKFDKPDVIHFDLSKSEVVISITGHLGDASETSIGEVSPKNNKNAYPFAMAEKRAKDRVILKLLGLHGDVYAQDEIDAETEEQIKKNAEKKNQQKALDPKPEPKPEAPPVAEPNDKFIGFVKKLTERFMECKTPQEVVDLNNKHLNRLKVIEEEDPQLFKSIHNYKNQKFEELRKE